MTDSALSESLRAAPGGSANDPRGAALVRLRELDAAFEAEDVELAGGRGWCRGAARRAPRGPGRRPAARGGRGGRPPWSTAGARGGASRDPRGASRERSGRARALREALERLPAIADRFGGAAPIRRAVVMATRSLEELRVAPLPARQLVERAEALWADLPLGELPPATVAALDPFTRRS